MDFLVSVLSANLSITLWVVTIFTGLFFVCGVPVFLCVVFWSLMASLAIHFPVENIGVSSYQDLQKYALLAMPLFILTGDLIGAGGIARKLSMLARRILAPCRGGLALATIATCSTFAAISGSNSATVATIGKIMIPEMKDQGYDIEFAATTAAAGGIVGILIPPSVLMIIYGVSVGVNASDLFKAGVLPGLFVSLALACSTLFWSLKNDWGKPEEFKVKYVISALWDAKLGLVAIALILVIIYGGISSPTEASGVTAVYCLVAGGFLLPKNWRKIPEIFLSSGRVNGLLAPVIAVSIVLQQVFMMIGVPTMVENFLGMFGSKYAVMAAIMLAIVIAGSIMESISICIILAPIVAPIAMSYGFDPVHFALIFIVGLSIGFITPPFGLDLFVASGITGIPYERLIRWVPPFLIFVTIAWIIIVAIPWLSLALL